MSAKGSTRKHRDARPAYADWTVSLFADEAGNSPALLVAGSVFERDAHGGYTFTDAGGVTADFPPGTVLHVMRHEPVPSEHAVALGAEQMRAERYDDDPRKRGTAASVKSGG